MKLLTLQQYMKMSKPALIRKITKALRAMPKVKLARLCYNITKAKLPRLRKTPQITDYGYSTYDRAPMRLKPFQKQRKTKRKFSRKQLAAQRLFAKRSKAGAFKRYQGWSGGIRDYRGKKRPLLKPIYKKRRR